jgi:hypothetical protein
MSLTPEEREQWRLEINRLNEQGWAEAKRDRVRAIQSANPGMSFETAWNKAEREQEAPAPEPATLGEAAKFVKSQHPNWTFEQSWRHAEAVYPELARGATAGSNGGLPKPFHQVEAAARALMVRDPRLTFGAALIRAREVEPPDPGTVKDPRMVQELAKHKKLDDVRQADAIDTNVDRLKKIRKLMVDKNWTFDQAFSEICRQEGEAKKTEVTSETQTAHAHVEPAAEPKIFLVRAIECGRELEYGLES